MTPRSRPSRALGGIAAIAVSHPHLAGSIVDWSRAFDHAPIYWHADNRRWVMRPDPAYVFWEGSANPYWRASPWCAAAVTSKARRRCTGRRAREGRGALLTGDTMQVAQDRRYVSFMYSYPNMIPLNRPAIERIVRAVEPFEFERLYSGWWDYVVTTEAKPAVKRSAERYIKAIAEE